MKTKKVLKQEEKLAKFLVEKSEAVKLEGGPKVSRGTVTNPSHP